MRKEMRGEMNRKETPLQWGEIRSKAGDTDQCTGGLPSY
jgi:hypothetical protein